VNSPDSFPYVHGKTIGSMKEDSGNKRFVRMLSWIEGRLWSTVNPIKDELLFSLGNEAGKITKALRGFQHLNAQRQLDWDLASYDFFYGKMPMNC